MQRFRPPSRDGAVVFPQAVSEEAERDSLEECIARTRRQLRQEGPLFCFENTSALVTTAAQAATAVRLGYYPHKVIVGAVEPGLRGQPQLTTLDVLRRTESRGEIFSCVLIDANLFGANAHTEVREALEAIPFCGRATLAISYCLGPKPDAVRLQKVLDVVRSWEVSKSSGGFTVLVEGLTIITAAFGLYRRPFAPTREARALHRKNIATLKIDAWEIKRPSVSALVRRHRTKHQGGRSAPRGICAATGGGVRLETAQNRMGDKAVHGPIGLWQVIAAFDIDRDLVLTERTFASFGVVVPWDSPPVQAEKAKFGSPTTDWRRIRQQQFGIWRLPQLSGYLVTGSEAEELRRLNAEYARGKDRFSIDVSRLTKSVETLVGLQLALDEKRLREGRRAQVQYAFLARGISHLNPDLIHWVNKPLL